MLLDTNPDEQEFSELNEKCQSSNSSHLIGSHCTWRPVDSSEWPEDPEDSENLEEANTRPAEDGNKGHRDNNDIQTVERLKN